MTDPVQPGALFDAEREGGGARLFDAGPPTLPVPRETPPKAPCAACGARQGCRCQERGYRALTIES